eukprot:6199340-Pleurochrysis_carterae.AAC.1
MGEDVEMHRKRKGREKETKGAKAADGEGESGRSEKPNPVSEHTGKRAGRRDRDGDGKAERGKWGRMNESGETS